MKLSARTQRSAAERAIVVVIVSAMVRVIIIVTSMIVIRCSVLDCYYSCHTVCY